MAKKASPNKSKSTSNKTWLRIFDKNYKFEDKDEVLDTVYWYRQVLAIFMGIIWGYIGFKGFMGIILFAVLNSIAAYAIANRTGYDFDPDDNFLSVKEGFMATFATFLVSWIVTYTASHFDQV